jgi:hypothetical protein
MTLLLSPEKASNSLLCKRRKGNRVFLMAAMLLIDMNDFFEQSKSAVMKLSTLLRLRKEDKHRKRRRSGLR